MDGLGNSAGNQIIEAEDDEGDQAILNDIFNTTDQEKINEEIHNQFDEDDEVTDDISNLDNEIDNFILNNVSLKKF